MDELILEGAREHNLEGVDRTIPRDSLNGRDDHRAVGLHAAVDGPARNAALPDLRRGGACVRARADRRRDPRGKKGEKLLVLAPMVRGRKGSYRRELEQWKKRGYVSARIDGPVLRLDEEIQLGRYHEHDIELVIDRLRVDPDKRALEKVIEIDQNPIGRPYRRRFGASISTETPRPATHRSCSPGCKERNARVVKAPSGSPRGPSAVPVP